MTPARTKVGTYQGEITRIPRKKPGEKSEFGFTETLSAATILVPQAIALHAAETDRNIAARVDSAETAVVFSITCCITTRHREPTSKPPTPAPPRCVRFLCSYLLPNQQVRDEPACKQQTHRNSSKPAPAKVRVFSFQDLVSDATTMTTAHRTTRTRCTTNSRGGSTCATRGAALPTFP
jgi:hypothetical protein